MKSLSIKIVVKTQCPKFWKIVKCEEEKEIFKVFFEIFPTKKWIHNESGEETDKFTKITF